MKIVLGCDHGGFQTKEAIKKYLEEKNYEVVDAGSTGFLGIGSRPAVINAKKKFSLEGSAEDFLKDYIHINIGALELSANHNILQIVDVCHDVEKDEK